ncbi:MAG: GNAT family N-acetyltransferase [Pseudomonadota bacterium]
MIYTIRLFKKSDAAPLARLTAASIGVVGAARYSPEQIAAWGARHPGPERFLERTDGGDLIWVAATPEDQPVAYALLEPPKADCSAHLDMLYCDPAHTRQGLADRLLTAAEEHAKQHGVNRLYTEASELARSAFERAGYAVTQRRDFTIPHAGNDVPIHNFAMEKLLG